MANTVLVTGGTGFLGARLAEKLNELGWEVHITSRSAGGRSGLITRHVCDFSDHDAASALLRRVMPKLVFHFAGTVSAKPNITLVLPTLHSHVTSTVNLLMNCTAIGVERVVIAGSMMEMLDEVPSSPYSAAKAVARLYAQMFYSLYATPVVVARTFATFGPGQSNDKVLPYVVRSLAQGVAPNLGSGEWRADWIFVDDVIDAFIAASSAPGIDGKVIDIGLGSLVSVREMVLTICALMGTSLTPHFGAREDRPNEPQRIADIERTTSLLGWSPQVSVEEGLRRTVSAYMDADKID